MFVFIINLIDCVRFCLRVSALSPYSRHYPAIFENDTFRVSDAWCNGICSPWAFVDICVDKKARSAGREDTWHNSLLLLLRRAWPGLVNNRYLLLHVCVCVCVRPNSQGEATNFFLQLLSPISYLTGFCNYKHAGQSRAIMQIRSVKFMGNCRCGADSYNTSLQTQCNLLTTRARVF